MSSSNNDVLDLAHALKRLRILRAVKFESISFVVILFALFFTKGYVYLETLNSRLGVPVSRLRFDGQLYAVYGGVDVLVFFTALFIALSGVLAFYWLMAFLDSPDRQRKSTSGDSNGWFCRRLRNSRVFLVFALAMISVSLCLYGVWSLVVSDSVKKGNSAAFKEVRDCEVSVIKLRNTDSIKGCIVGESDDMLYWVNKIKQDHDSVYFEKGMVPKELIFSKISLGRIQMDN